MKRRFVDLSRDDASKPEHRATDADQTIRRLYPSLIPVFRRVVFQHAANQRSQLRLGGVGGGDDLLDVGRLERVGEAHVGDDREAERAQAAVDGDDRLGNRRHADDVGADRPQEAILGPRFQVRAGDGDRHAAVGDEVLLPGDFEARFDQLGIVGPRHIGEPRAEAVVVDADQRVVAHQIDVVVDDHHVAGAVVRIHAADGLRDDQQLRAQAASSRAPAA